MSLPVTSFVDRRPRLNIVLRSLLALFGAYALASLGAAALAVGLPLPRLDAAMSAIMLGFVIQLLAVLWVYAAATVTRASLGIAIPALAFGAWLALEKCGGLP